MLFNNYFSASSLRLIKCQQEQLKINTFAWFCNFGIKDDYFSNWEFVLELNQA